MKKISKKTILKPNKGTTVQIEEKLLTDSNNNSEYYRKISQTSKISRSNIIDSKSNITSHNNTTENIIQKKYS
jgi:hypothetical protein